MSERLQRRKKKPAEASDQPAPPPLQPAYFDAEQEPESAARPAHVEAEAERLEPAPSAADAARRYFETKFQRRQVPDNAPVFKLADELWVCELMKQLRFAASTTEARRLLSQGAVRVDGETVTDVNFHFVPGEHKILEVGKRRVARIER